MAVSFSTRAAGVLTAALVCGCASASTFNISPIRAQLSGAHRTEVLTLMNADDAPVVVQVHLVAWTQQNGEEHLEDTREVLVTPPVLQIAAHGEQIVRVALRREPDPSRELSYRVIFEEVPQAAPASFNGLRVALRLSVPVFVAPLRPKPAAEVAWEVRPLPEGKIEVAATNRGSAHLQVTDFTLHGEGALDAVPGKTSKYVLPGSRVTWELTPRPGTATVGVRTSALIVEGHSDQGEFSSDVAANGL